MYMCVRVRVHHIIYAIVNINSKRTFVTHSLNLAEGKNVNDIYYKCITINNVSNI